MHKAVTEQALDPCSMIGKPENPAPVAALMTAGGSLGPVGVLNLANGSDLKGLLWSVFGVRLMPISR